ncbi:MAG: ATP-dependent RecD-like DNA helicase [Oscillospiraceae bacterium]|nr:ATP-dependent RecD-like DNA helicase [Oscillospiraceae bacterium]
MDEHIEGTIEAVVFSNPENGYAVLRLSTVDGVVTAAGNVPGVQPGERVLLTGSWTVHQQYGEQFKVEAFEMRPPSGADEIFRYLASGAIKNIGPAKARDIVEKFGNAALDVIENEPDKLSSVKGISLKSALKIGEGYRRQAGLRRLIDFLGQYGIKPIVATRVYKDFGDNSVEAVRNNPYIITYDFYGADFAEADTIALDLGFDSDCPERVSAALIFELVHNLGNGHTFIPKDKLSAATDTLISAGFDAINDGLDALCECGDVVVEEIAGVQACYLRHMHEAEVYIASRISGMIEPADAGGQNSFSYKTELSTASIATIISNAEAEDSISFAPSQRKALEFAGSSHVMALTGGPGTGKTTTVRGILTLFDAMGLKTELCAPTGRAAKRLSETCMRDAATIHRLLGTAPGEDGLLIFDKDEENPLSADAVIVDESSMLDILLMRSLLAAMKPGSRLIMVGDADQLPPVGPGNVFADILRSETVPTVALSEIFRQAAGSGIVRCAHSINKGIMPDLAEKYPDLFFMRRSSEEQLAETVAELYGERLPKNMGIDPSLIQVLSPTRKREAGTASLNLRLREAVNPPGALKKEKQYGDNLFRTGDKVMQIRNNYDIIWKTPDGMCEGMGVFNGDVGYVREIDHDLETLTVDFDDKLVTYLFEQLPELEPAFAMTVHKSQGSEYHAVILAMTRAAPPLLTRGVLYTAMTRAKNLLVIVGTPEVMNQMILNDRRLRRYSGLRARLVLCSGEKQSMTADAH